MAATGERGAVGLICRLWLVTLALVANSGAAAPPYCDPSLAPSTNHPVGYAERGDRCEGVYIQAVSGTIPALASFTAAFGALDPGSGQPLIVEWPAPLGTRDVQLRALSLQ